MVSSAYASRLPVDVRHAPGIFVVSVNVTRAFSVACVGDNVHHFAYMRRCPAQSAAITDNRRQSSASTLPRKYNLSRPDIRLSEWGRERGWRVDGVRSQHDSFVATTTVNTASEWLRVLVTQMLVRQWCVVHIQHLLRHFVATMLTLERRKLQ